MRTAIEKLILLALLNLVVLVAIGYLIVMYCGGDCGGGTHPGVPWGDP